MKQKPIHKPANKPVNKPLIKGENKKAPGEPFFTVPYMERYGLWITLGLVSLLILIIFHNFIAGNIFYLFKDIGSDSINFSYPNYISYIRYIKREGFPLWAFDQGMGQEIMSTSLVDPFFWIVYLFGEHNAAYGMVWMEITKIAITAFVFYKYLKVLGLSNTNALIGTLLFSFSGFMIVGGAWIVFSVEACSFAILLLGFEKLYKQNSWYLFPVAIALICIMRPFSLYFYGLFLIFYFLFRHFSSDDFSWNRLLVSALKYLGLAVIGILMSSFLFVSGIQLMVDSPRVGGSSSYFNQLLAKSLFFMEKPLHYTTVILRTFSNDMLGNGSNYKGWYNYLEAPLTYIGVLPLVLFPQIFLMINRKKKIVYSIFLALFILPIIFPYFRYAFWAFTGDYYRGFSIFFSLTLLFFSLEVIHEVEKNKKINLVVLIVSSFALLALLYFPFQGIEQALNQQQQVVAAFFIILYTILSVLLSTKHNKGQILAFMVIAVFTELAYTNYKTVNDRVCLTKAESLQKVGYNDYTVDAIEFIKRHDTGFFRVNKDYASGPAMHRSLNDAKIQDYYGTLFYTSFNQKYYIRFLEETGVIHKGVESESRWARGLSGKPLLQIFGSVKYNLSKSANPFFLKMGYDSITQVGDVKILKNKYFLPLGFTYDKFIPSPKFQKLSGLQKDLVLLQAVVTEEPPVGILGKLQEFNVSDTIKSPTPDEIEKLTVARKTDTLHITHFSNNRITGTINIPDSRLLFFSIPFDRGWNARIDDKEVKPFLCNYGFNGLMLTGGQHHIELYYKPPFFSITLVISLLGILLYILLYVADSAFKKKRGTPLD